MMLSILVNVIGIVLIAMILWWFIFFRQRSTTIENNIVTITVNNGVYEPAIIEAPLNESITLRFRRLDPSPCAAIVQFKQLEVSHELPMNTTQDIKLKLDKPGDYEFTCQMGMYRGKLIISSKQ